ncbi:MAG: tyrosine-type recombinase/integrase [Saprospiraceae bacterium]|nr:tyrosine-type recombinase/integrase [Saprospiraceae bacterium]MCB9323534.1 tyrosine-type recombinase/integrase [Lewinellaceae bacterium]
MSTPTLAVKLYKGEPLANNYFPIVLEVRYPSSSGKLTTSRIRLKVKAKEHEWDDSIWFKRDEKKNQQLEYSLDQANRVYERFFRNSHFDYIQFSKLFRNGLHKNFYDVMDEFIDSRSSVGNQMFYKDIKRAIRKLWGDNLAIRSIDKRKLEQFGNRYESVAYFRGFKAVMSYAREKGYIDIKEYPFKAAYYPDGYDFNHIKKKKQKSKEPEIAYTEEEMKVFNQRPDDRGQRAWDVFMLSYYFFGTNLWDMIHFTDENKRGDGLVYRRKKTGVLVRMPIVPQAWEIIERYRNGKYWFPIVDPDLPEPDKKRKANNLRRSVNRTLRRLARDRGTDQRVKFYTARHTAATIAIKKGAPIQEVSALLGHKSIKTTQIYLAQFDVKELSGTMGLLTL